jgi:hypothetical protein
VNKFKPAKLFLGKKQKHKHRVLTEMLDATGATLEHTPIKSLKCLAQKTGASTSSARTATQMLKCRPYKTTVIQAHPAAVSSKQQRTFLHLASTVCH